MSTLVYIMKVGYVCLYACRYVDTDTYIYIYTYIHIHDIIRVHVGVVLSYFFAVIIMVVMVI